MQVKAKGFSLNKQEFTDDIILRYGLIIEGLPDLCSGCSSFEEQHTMNMSKVRINFYATLGGKRHYYLYFESSFRYVATELKLIPMSITSEHLKYTAASRDHEDAVNISTCRF